MEINLYFSSFFFFFDGNTKPRFSFRVFSVRVCSFARAFKFFITAHTSIIK